MPTETVLAPDEAAVETLGANLAASLPHGAVLVLSGPLGAGKTTFARGLARGAGVNADVTSPTYAYVHEYPAPGGPFVHIDAYRLDDPRRLWSMGLQDMLDRARLTAIEWGEALLEQLDDAILVTLEAEGGGRRVTIHRP